MNEKTLAKKSCVNSNHDELEMKILLTKSKLRGFINSVSQRPKTWRWGLQHLRDVSPVDELRHELRRLTILEKEFRND